jgi:hypothetical protein
VEVSALDGLQIDYANFAGGWLLLYLGKIDQDDFVSLYKGLKSLQMWKGGLLYPL